jgi:hypothetical protein
MIIFTIYNPTTKEIAEEREFKNYIEAGKYTKENYPEGFVSKHEPFHFSSDFNAMLLEGTHPRIKTNDRGEHVAIIDEDSRTVLHKGAITMGQLAYMRRAQIPTKQISKVEFINLHNSLIRSTNA